MKLQKIIFILAGLTLVLLVITLPARKQLQNFNRLTLLAHEYGTDKGPSSHYYTELYDRFFLPMEHSARKVFEIGIEKGASLKMWRQYFPNAVIYGIDIEDCSRFNSGKIKTFVADQANRGRLKESINAFGGDFDIILDDGGHSMQQQQVSFGYLFKYVKPGGYYIIEDVHTSLVPGYGTEQNGENTTLAMIEDFIRAGKIKSKYMTEEERGYLTDHIEFCNLFRRRVKTGEGLSITCIFKKKSVVDKLLGF